MKIPSRPLKGNKIFPFLSCALTLPPAKDYNLMLKRVISLKAYSKHSLKVQDPCYVLVLLFYLSVFMNSMRDCTKGCQFG